MWLLANGVGLDGRDYRLRTPLMHAACTSKPLLVELLLRGGANVDDTDASGATALHLAVASAYMAQEGASHKRCFRWAARPEGPSPNPHHSTREFRRSVALPPAHRPQPPPLAAASTSSSSTAPLLAYKTRRDTRRSTTRCVCGPSCRSDSRSSRSSCSAVQCSLLPLPPRRIVFHQSSTRGQRNSNGRNASRSCSSTPHSRSRHRCDLD